MGSCNPGEKTIKTQLQTSRSLAYTYIFFNPTPPSPLPPKKHLRIYQFIHLHVFISFAELYKALTITVIFKKIFRTFFFKKTFLQQWQSTFFGSNMILAMQL